MMHAMYLPPTPMDRMTDGQTPVSKSTTIVHHMPLSATSSPTLRTHIKFICYPNAVHIDNILLSEFYQDCYNLLPPANEVWGKVIFLHLFVILFTRGFLVPGGAWLRPPPPGRLLLRALCFLLECILVCTVA